MSKKQPRIRCLVCDTLVAREMLPDNLKAPYCLISLNLPKARGCICSDCVNYHSNLDEERTLKAFKGRQNSNTPLSEEELMSKKYDVLDYSIDSLSALVKGIVFGQDAIVDKVIYTMYFNQVSNLLGEATEKPVKPKHILLIGDTGVGKTLLATTAAKVMRLPYAVSNATSITSAGYIGDKVENILERLYYAAGGNMELAENGVVIIDEIDKKATKKEMSGRDIVGESVQQELLKLLEPSTIYITIDKQSKPFRTDNITIIMCGAYVGLDDIMRKRLQPAAIGFGANDKEINVLNEKILPDDLIKFGFIPEFVGRQPIVRRLNPLSPDVIVEIIYSILLKYNVLFDAKQFTLSVDQNLVQKMAELAIESKTGARDLEGRIDELMYPALRKVFQSLPGGICEIHEDGSTELIYYNNSKPGNVNLLKIPGDPIYIEAED